LENDIGAAIERRQVVGRGSDRSLHEEEKGEEKVGDGEPAEEHDKDLVASLDHKHDLAEEPVVRFPDFAPVDDRVEGGKVGAVEPASALRDQLGDAVGHVGDRRRVAFVAEEPRFAGFGNQLKAKNTVLGEVHAV
jgi:hypothetical protein